MYAKIRNVVAGVATTGEEDPVLAPAAGLAAPAGAVLHLVHALDDQASDEEARAAEARLEEQARRYAPDAVLRCRALRGPPGEVLTALAESTGAELVVVGPTRRGTLARKLLGTTAERVLHRARRPVLVVRPPLQRPLRRVLLTTDLSELSEAVHERGLDLLEAAFGEDAPVLRSLLVEERATAGAREREALLEEAGERLGGFLRGRSPRVHPVEGYVRAGTAAREIASATVDWFPDLLVLGTHGRTGAARALLGSVADAALRSAQCSVLVVPASAVAREVAGAEAQESRGLGGKAATLGRDEHERR